jgi:hypothetical protein
MERATAAALSLHALYDPLQLTAVGCAAPSVSDDVGPLEGAWRLTALVDVVADARA